MSRNHTPVRLNSARFTATLIATLVATTFAACADLSVRPAQGDKAESGQADKGKTEVASSIRIDAAAASGAASTEVAAVAATGQVPPVTPQAGAVPGAMPFGLPGATPDPRRYDQVITKDARTAKGLVLHHVVKERHYFEIPEALLGRDLFWSVEVAQASESNIFNGLPLGHKVIRFERVGNRILLRGVTFGRRGSTELKAATDAVGLAPILMAFNVETEGSEQSLLPRPAQKTPETKPDAAAPSASTNTPSAANTKTDASTDTAADSMSEPDMKVAAALAKATNAAKAAVAAAEAAKLPPAKEKWPVIEVTRLLTTTSPDLVDSRSMGPSGLMGTDPSRSLVNQVKVFPRNVEIRSDPHLLRRTHPADAGPRPAVPAHRAAQSEPQRRVALQPGGAAAGTDDGSLCRPARGLLHGRLPGIRRRPQWRASARVHHALPSRQEGAGRRRVGCGDADRVLYRPGSAGEMAQGVEAGRRGLAAGV